MNQSNKKLNSIGLLPTFTKSEFEIVRKILRELKNSPLEVDSEKSFLEFKHSFQKLFPASKSIFYTDSARSAFALLLDSLKLPKGSEVILPGFTCVVIVNPVLWANLTPVYTDVSFSDFNQTLEGVLSKVTTKTKIIMIQHSFGAIFPVSELSRKLIEQKREDIVIVEDVAHSLNTNQNPPRDKNEFTSDALISTFGYEKVFSTIRGGALILNNDSHTEQIEKTYSVLPDLPEEKIKKLLQNPIFWNRILPIYFFGFGKYNVGNIALKFARIFGITGIAIDPIEYSGGKPTYVPAKFPKILSTLGTTQLKKLDQINRARRENANYYYEYIQGNLPILAKNQDQEYIKNVLTNNKPHLFLRYPVLLKSKEERDKLFLEAKKYRIVLGDWYKTMFYTKPEYYKNIKYTEGQCPNAEDIANRIINLPTSPNTTTAQKEIITKLLSTCCC